MKGATYMQTKKQIVLLLLLAAVLCTAAGFQVVAAEQYPETSSFDGIDISYKEFVIENGVLIKYQGVEEEVIVPEGITEIGHSAFAENETLRSVILPEGVAVIGEKAFYDCVNLETVIFPASLREIKYAAFELCKKLQEAIFSEGLEIMEEYAFGSCWNLERLELPNTLQEINGGAFSSCKNLKEVIIPEGVKKIGNEAFWACDSLTSIQIPSTVTEPGNSMTYNTPWLEEKLASLPAESPFFIIGSVLIAAREDLEIAVTVPDGVMRIADHAFQRTSFTSITLPDSVEEIESAAFQGCKKLERVYMADSVKTVGTNLFYECPVLKEVRLSNSIKILEDPFYKCPQLEEIELPAKLENLIGRTFVSCKKLKKVVVHSKLKKDRACCLPNGTDIREKNVSKKIVIYVDKGSPAEKYLRSLKGEEKIAYAYNKNSSSSSVSYKTYTVKKGDSLWAIAKKQLGSGSRYPEIVKLNQLGKKGIQPGQKLKIPKK